MNKLIAFALLALCITANAGASQKLARLLQVQSKNAAVNSCSGTGWECELVMAVGYSAGMGNGKAMGESGDNYDPAQGSSEKGEVDTIGSQILRSHDGGITWEVLTIGANMASTVNSQGVHSDGFALTGLSIGNGDLGADATAQSAMVAVVGFDSNQNGATNFWISHDGGRTYTQKDADGLGNAGERPVVACDDKGSFCVVGGDGFWYTADSGASFSAEEIDGELSVSKVWCGDAACSRGGFSGSLDDEGVVYSFDVNDAETGMTIEQTWSQGSRVNDVYTTHDKDEGHKVFVGAPPMITAHNSLILDVHTQLDKEPLTIHCIGMSCVSSVEGEGGQYYISENGAMTWGNTLYHLENTSEESGTGGDATGVPFEDEIGLMVTVFSSVAGDDGTDVWYSCTNDGGCYMSKDIYNTWTQIPASIFFDTTWSEGASSTFNGDSANADA